MSVELSWNAERWVSTRSAAKVALLARRFAFSIIAMVASSAVAVEPLVSSSAKSWSNFQNQGALVLSDALVPVTWSAKNGIAWQTNLTGYGQSSPVVARELVFVTSTSGPNKERYHLTAYRLSDGQQAWQVSLDNPSPTPNNNYVSRAAPSPALDDQGVIAFFEGGLAIAVDYEGKKRWERNFVADFGPIESRHGLGGSVEQDQERAYFWVERSAAPYLIALSKATGKVEWKVPGLGATSWSSPRLVPLDKSQQLVCSAGGIVAGFDPATGKRLWELKDVEGNTTATPIPMGNGRFILAASEGRGEESSGKGSPSNGLVKITATADGFQAEFVWRATKATSSFGSPIVVNDRVYFVNRAGVIYGVDANTGEELFTKRGTAGSIWATPIFANEHLYLFGKSGATAVYKLGETIEEVSLNKLWENAAENAPAGEMGSGPVLYAAAVASPYLILRRGDILFAVK